MIRAAKKLTPTHIIALAFIPLQLFLLSAPLVAKSDDLHELASPREIFTISGKAKAQKIAALPVVPAVSVKKTMTLTVTAYSSTVDQTDGDPFTTASGSKVHVGTIAHNTLPFGTRVRFPDAFGDKVFVVEDRLNPRHGAYIADMWMTSRQEAKQWGRRVLRMEILSGPAARPS